MAKKTSKKTAAEKPAEDKKKRAQYDPFILGPMTEIITKHCDEIRQMCSEFTGIEEMPLDYWKRLDTIVLDVLKAAADSNWHTHHMRMTYLKRQSPYSLSCRVREQQSRKYIVEWVDNIREDGHSEDWKSHCCYQIFTHIAIMLSENSKNEK